MYDDWPPIGEVKLRTGMSERSIYRAVNDGKLRQATRPIPGRKPLPVYHPEDVAALEAASVPSASQVLPPLAESRQLVAESRQLLPPPAFWQALIERLTQHPAELSQPAELAESPLYVSEAEAMRRTGWGRQALRKSGAGKRNGPRGALVYRREDLDKL